MAKKNDILNAILVLVLESFGVMWLCVILNGKEYGNYEKAMITLFHVMWCGTDTNI